MSQRVTSCHRVVLLTNLMSVYWTSVVCQTLGWDLESPKRIRNMWSLCLLSLSCNSDRFSDKLWLKVLILNKWRTWKKKASGAYTACTWVPATLRITKSPSNKVTSWVRHEELVAIHSLKNRGCMKNLPAEDWPLVGWRLAGWRSRCSSLWGVWRVRKTV